MSSEDDSLGMKKLIPRRDFLNGVAVAITASNLVAGAKPLPSQASAANLATDYPPARDGLRGSTSASLAEFDPIRRGAYAQFPVPDQEITEEYDLVIVGAGISGLSAAHFYRTALGPEQRILILDNNDDFGGHAKRNEFHHEGQTFIGFGGTMSIATPYPYSYAAKALITEVGIDVSRDEAITNRELEKYNLKAGTFFDKEHFTDDRLVLGNPHQASFFAQAPLTDAARKDLVRLYGKNSDYMAGMSRAEKVAKLTSISYQEYLLGYAKMTPEALPFFLGNGGRNHKRVDTTPALEAARHGAAGFNGLGLKLGEMFNEGSYYLHFPDGNASVARLLVSKLVPAALPGKQSMDTVVQSKLLYENLDQPGTKVRIRLSSPVVRVLNDAPPEHSNSVKVAYIKEGKPRAVRGKYCIVACYNALIPSLMPEIPETQKQALAYPVKVPMLYTNVLIRQWTAFQKLGVSTIQAPCMYYPYATLDPGTTVGGYNGATTPDKPILVHLVRSPNKPGLPRKEQNRIGQQELLTMTFEQHELEIRRQFARMLGRGGFNPADDILAITVNRWPYGYAYTYDTLADPDVPQEERPHVLGRKRFGRVTIANSDAGAAAFTNQAMDEANRAVQEILINEGLT